MTHMPFFPRASRSDRDRRRDDDGVQALEFELDTLEFVAASDELGLLRIGGRWFAPARRELGEIVLVVERDSEMLEVAPMPDLHGVAPLASPDGEEWHGAFTMSVEVAEDARTELALAAGPDAEVALPRPGEWERLKEEHDAPDAPQPPEPESPVIADLVAQLDEVAQLEADAPAPAPEPVSEPIAAAAMPPPPPPPPPPAVDDVGGLRAELGFRANQVEELRAELEGERRLRQQLEEELRTRAAVEDDLRNALAMREAVMASAVAQAVRTREAERRRTLAVSQTAAAGPEGGRSAADEEFIARLERARRASDASS